MHPTHPDLSGSEQRTEETEMRGPKQLQTHNDDCHGVEQRQLKDMVENIGVGLGPSPSRPSIGPPSHPGIVPPGRTVIPRR